ncbi:hypothetical protein [Dyella choica]|uniref:Uncharacterized protein n=1 Tax=Dyella choica TaxID=1927959 RepID=A0A3S0R2A4_9GAMM|nr:hypothetical protein [Dyella choica]RUL73000.1 hypothetical protein EKH80_16730 [Dyella choica]
MLTLTACSDKRIACPKKESLEQFRRVDDAQVIRRADNAFDRGDKRLLGVRSVGLLVPSFGENPDDYRFGIRVIGETSDTPCDKDEAALNDNAVRYSGIYNKEMLKRVASSNQSPAKTN